MEWEFGLSWEWLFLFLSVFSALWLVRCAPRTARLLGRPAGMKGEKSPKPVERTKGRAPSRLTPRLRLGHADEDDEDVTAFPEAS